MSLENFSYLIAFILLVASIISPIATAIINNKHQTNIKKLDMYENAKRDALSNFIDAAEHCLFASEYIDENMEFSSAINKLFIYFDNVSMSSIKTLSDKIAKTQKSNGYADANHALANIVQELSLQIKKS